MSTENDRKLSQVTISAGRPRGQAEALRAEGRTIRHIAAELNLPRSTVGDWLIRSTGHAQPKPCRICGRSTTSRIGICSRTAECRNEAVCHRKGYTKRLRCAGCGGPMRSHCTWRFCMRNPQCRSLRNAEMRRVDPGRLRAHARRSAAKHREKYHDRDLIRRRLCGTGPANPRGVRHHSWAGGHIVFCSVCGQCAGWRSPSQIRRRRKFLCKEHALESWKWNLSQFNYKSQQAVR